jgi:hypothetical protein
MLAPEILLSPTQSGNSDGTLPFQEPDHRSHRILGGNGQADVHMVRLQMPFDDLALLLPGQGMENLPQLAADSSKQHLPPSLAAVSFSEIGLGFKKGRLRGHDIRASGRQVRVRPMGIAALFPSNLKVGMTAS